VRCAQPCKNSFLQAEGQRSEFLDFRIARDSRCLINPAAAFRSERLQRNNNRPVIPDRQFKRFDGVVVCAAALNTSAIPTVLITMERSSSYIGEAGSAL
jgi:hypothetical protein